MASYILHIGDGKCGSTSIQESLLQARSDLSNLKILYESTPTQTNHEALEVLAGRPTRANNEKLKKQGIDILRRIGGKISKYDYCLISAEHLVSIDPMNVFEAVFGGIEKSAEINFWGVCYLRSPTSLYLSFIQQQIKGQARFTPPEHFKFDIDEKLRIWQSACPADHLIVRVFSPDRLVNRSVVNDFSQVLQKITGRAVTLPDVRKNTSLSAEQMIVLQELRREILPEMDGRLSPISNNLVVFFEMLNRSGLVGTRPALTSKARHIVSERTKDRVFSLNAMFPDLRMSTAPASAEAADAPSSPRDQTCVSSVLTANDSKIAACLRALCPHLSPALRKEITDEAKEALHLLVSRLGAPIPTVRSAITEYWSREGCTSAKAYIEESLAPLHQPKEKTQGPNGVG